MWGRSVRFVQGERAVVGEARDVAPDGGLVVRLESGVTTVLHSGDVHLVPVIA
jgi:biotin-(acetyl-CoA carboxylase) ligase